MTRFAPVSLTLNFSFALRHEARSLLLDHLQELLFFVLSQLLVLLHALDIQLVLGLGPWGLKRTRQDGDLGILYRSGHLRVRHVLVNNDSLDERRVLQRSSDFAIDLDQLKVYVSSFEVGHGEHGINGDLSELFVCDRDAVQTQDAQALCVSG